jgi:SAM-dependent methyltransferase
MSYEDHWEQVYATNPIEKVGWYEPHLQPSVRWIKRLRLAADAPIVDAGGGASTLVDDLLDAGYRSITVLDVSAKALSLAKARLGTRAELVTWLCGDITSVDLPTQHYELWHDRALFHFLIELEPRWKYIDNLLKALKPGGQLIIGSFAPESPPQCSGLPVQRYSPKQLGDTLGEEFQLERQHKQPHTTPGGVEQMYLYCHFRRTG